MIIKKPLATYIFRIIITVLSIYYLGKELWFGAEGFTQTGYLLKDISTLEQKRDRLKDEIKNLNYKLSLFNDPEFLEEYSMREKDLKKQGDIVYLI